MRVIRYRVGHDKVSIPIKFALPSIKNIDATILTGIEGYPPRWGWFITLKVLTSWTMKVGEKGAQLAMQGLDILHWKEGKLLLKSIYGKTEVPQFQEV